MFGDNCCAAENIFTEDSKNCIEKQENKLMNSEPKIKKKQPPPNSSINSIKVSRNVI